MAECIYLSIYLHMCVYIYVHSIYLSIALSLLQCLCTDAMLFMWFGARKCSFRFCLDSDFVGVCDLSNKYLPFPLLPALCAGQGRRARSDPREAHSENTCAEGEARDVVEYRASGRAIV